MCAWSTKKNFHLNIRKVCAKCRKFCHLKSSCRNIFCHIDSCQKPYLSKRLTLIHQRFITNVSEENFWSQIFLQKGSLSQNFLQKGSWSQIFLLKWVWFRIILQKVFSQTFLQKGVWLKHFCRNVCDLISFCRKFYLKSSCSKVCDLVSFCWKVWNLGFFCTKIFIANLLVERLHDLRSFCRKVCDIKFSAERCVI